MAPRPLIGRDHERALLDAWREAHWSLRLALQDVARRSGSAELERLYDAARRSDNQLSDFYRARAEGLERQLRKTSDARSCHDPLTIGERALVGRFRAMSEDDRAALLRLVAQLASA